MKAVTYMILLPVVLGIWVSGCETIQQVLDTKKPTASLTGLGFDDVSLESATLIFDVEIDNLRKMGVKFITNFIVGKTASIDDLKKEGFVSFFVASGAGLPRCDQERPGKAWLDGRRAAAAQPGSTFRRWQLFPLPGDALERFQLPSADADRQRVPWHRTAESAAAGDTRRHRRRDIYPARRRSSDDLA